MHFRPIFCALALVTSVLLAPLASAQDLSVTPDHSNGVYAIGEIIRWTVHYKGSNAIQASVVLKRGGLTETRKDTVTLANGKGVIESRLDEPGWLLAEVTVRAENTKAIKALGGAVVAPDKIKRADPRPADFDQFWADKLKELSGIPANPKLETTDGRKPGVDYSLITFDNIRGTKIRGQIARPQQGAKFPAMLIVQWAGVYGLQKQWVTDRAAEGWLCLNISAHDLPIDRDDAFYKEQASTALKDYPAIGNDSRETSYFLRMYLSCYRAAEYLATRPDWDGKTLVVTGGSQGGLQSFVTAGLHPKITAVMASVPAGCDLNGPEAGRRPGWPMWYWATKDKDEKKVRDASRYFDVVNFASRIECPVLVGAGLIDTTCPVPGIMAACNELKGTKEIAFMPVAEHGEKYGSHRLYNSRFNIWKSALVKGSPAPLP